MPNRDIGDRRRIAPDGNQDFRVHLAQQPTAQDEPPDAPVCASDYLAAGAILGLREQGLRVPRTPPSSASTTGLSPRTYRSRSPPSPYRSKTRGYQPPSDSSRP
jgi:hypothetical protein